MLWGALTESAGLRTRDLLHKAVVSGFCEEHEARSFYQLLQTDDLHNLGGPPW